MEADQQLICSICSEYFQIPVTIACGHTFCKNCLVRATKEKLVCPLCRCLFMRSAQHLKQNITISNLLRKKRSNIQNTKDKQQKYFRETKNQQQRDFNQQKEIINCILLVLTTQDLILPYSKKNINFQLSNDSIIQQLKNVVIVQDLPYGKNIVYGKITVNNTRQNNLRTFDGLFETISFFEITETKQIEAESSTHQIFKVNICTGNKLIKNSRLELNQFNYFFSIFDRIHQPHHLRQIYDQIDYRILSQKNNPQAILLCILSLLRIQNQTKYKILQFQFEDQISYIDSFLRKFDIEGLIRNPQIAFNLHVPGNFNEKIILFLAVFLIVGYYCGWVY